MEEILQWSAASDQQKQGILEMATARRNNKKSTLSE